MKTSKRLIVARGSRTREEVAAALGISVSAIAMYETGRRIPRDSIKQKLANYYHLTVQEIFFCRTKSRIETFDLDWVTKRG